MDRSRLKDTALAIGGVVGVILFMLLMLLADGVLILVEFLLVGSLLRVVSWLFG